MGHSLASVIHFLRPSKRNAGHVTLGFFIVLSVGILIAGKIHQQTTESIRNTIVDITMPVVAVVAFPAKIVQDTVSFIQEIGDLRKENARLNAENKKLKKSFFTAIQMAAENKQLRKLMQYNEPTASNIITARVVSNNTSSFFHSALLNVGTKQGVRKGQAVVNEKGLVGRIIEAGKQTARVLLVTDINSRIPVITSKSRERAVVAGNNTANPSLLYLPEDSKVMPGEIIFTTGDGQVFPADQPVGVVSKKENGTITITPFSEWARLEYVTVIN